MEFDVLQHQIIRRQMLQNLSTSVNLKTKSHEKSYA